jgi:protein-L-isoaspartate O-methyltransferase
VTKDFLSNDGYAVHVVPSRWIKVSYLFLHYPNLIFLVMDRLWGKLQGEAFFRGADINFENNINLKEKSLSTNRWFKKIILPPVHGNFSSHWQEFKSFGRKDWESLFKRAGYSIASYSRGPAFSGYGFGFFGLRSLLEFLGFFSEHIFILKKMPDFEFWTRAYTEDFLIKGNFYEKEKFILDWLNKEKTAKFFLADFKKELGDPQGKHVLDVGFGNGIILSEFSRSGALVSGLETEEKLFGLANKYFKDRDLTANLMIYNGKNFPFPDNTFDYVYSTSVFEHMSHPQDVLSEISRTLVPGGKFFPL